MTNKLANFLVKAKKNTYASIGEGGEIRLEDGAKELSYKDEDFSYRDRYYGSKDFAGEEIVWQGGKVIWGMNYYGMTTKDDIDAEKVYSFLKLALSNVTTEMPFRGPENLKKDNCEYVNKIEGSLKSFCGKEEILLNGQVVYQLYYHGGRIR
ncbi:MAG: hypothetical protein UT66_C0028G0016 [candidate division CPR2 bacterium GW2011_GWC1_39_9]|uniref:DUF5680 domain-containing protein n=1 Tax=candidate division CPR2 bacterium GW2011_GWC2_39_10 TaxID=1618345 RepID=A0A0G0PZE5_UNCC2|nr:MAG: hypothetical protein UT18_C0007G0042 [candidate division CPR2 bacterium GW2011_GWC2_39_10]KKR34125.1 MAG: hypothetical protein UT66_C0028G0016 [candidate division CPR2 bacterium GW2011_GWC1_39_9]